MAKDKKDKVKPITDRVRDALGMVTKTTKESQATLYGIQHDPTEALSRGLIHKASVDIAKKNTSGMMNSNLSMYRQTSRVNMDRERFDSKLSGRNKAANLYDIIKDAGVSEQIANMMTGTQMDFQNLMRDYETIRRSIPKIHKCITTLVQNICNPDSISRDIVGIKFNNNMDADDIKRVKNALEKYELDKSVRRAITEYLTISVSYIVDVPYRHIVNMLLPDEDGHGNMLHENGTTHMTINETVQYIQDGLKIFNETVADPKPLGSGFMDNDILNESYNLMESTIPNTSMTPAEVVNTLNENVEQWNSLVDCGVEIDKDKNKLSESTIQALEELVKENVILANGAVSHYKEDILTETSLSISASANDNSMSGIINRMGGKRKNSRAGQQMDYITKATAKKIEKLKLKGCRSEFLDQSRVLEFMAGDVVIGYLYIHDDVIDNSRYTTIMSQVTSAIHKSVAVNPFDNGEILEKRLIKSIGDALVSEISDDFIVKNARYMDAIYEFIKAHELHTKRKRVTFFHPDEIVAFKREEGSILTNIMFTAKLYILTVLHDTITNVTRGADRTAYFVSQGLSSDIEGKVDRAIRAVKHNQLRYSDLATVNEVFNVVGSGVDVFFPRSSDGQQPVDIELLPGQQVDMHREWLEYMEKQLVMGLGSSMSASEMHEEPEHARTITMSNLDAAKSVMDEQVELAPALTKRVRNLIMAEFPDNPEYYDIDAYLNAPAVIVREMNRTLLDSVEDMSNIIAELYIPEDGESPSAKRRRIIRRNYYKTAIPTIEWDEIEQMIEDSGIDISVEDIKDKLTDKTFLSDDDEGGGGYGGY